MKKILLLALVLHAAKPVLFAQCESAVSSCEKYMEEGFISDGQIYWSMLGADELTEFQTVFFSGTTYRIAAYSGQESGNLLFRILDVEGRELYTNQKFSNAPYWDFRMDSTQPVTIEARIDPTRAADGCVAMLISFKR